MPTASKSLSRPWVQHTGSLVQAKKKRDAKRDRILRIAHEFQSLGLPRDAIYQLMWDKGYHAGYSSHDRLQPQQTERMQQWRAGQRRNPKARDLSASRFI